MKTVKPLSPEQLDALVDAHLAAEVRQDLPAVLDTLSSDIVHDVVGAPAAARGLEQVAAFYRGLWADLAVDEMRPVRRLHAPQFVVDEVMVSARAVGRPFGFDGRGRRVEFRLVHVFEFEDDRIVRETAALDLPALSGQLA
jgi:predicted ester cyclase